MNPNIRLTCFLFVVTLLLSSCKKSDVEPEYDEGPFNYGPISGIQANGSVLITLKQGLSNRLVKKTVGGPQMQVSGGYMILNGGGEVVIEVKDPLFIGMNTGGVQTDGAVSLKQLSVSGQAYNAVLDELTVDSVLSIGVSNTGDVVAKGSAGYLSVATVNFGRFFGFDLITDSCQVSHTGISDVQVNVTQKLTGSVNSLGNLFYKGNPSVVNVSTYGSGRAIPK